MHIIYLFERQSYIQRNSIYCLFSRWLQQPGQAKLMPGSRSFTQVSHLDAGVQTLRSSSTIIPNLLAWEWVRSEAARTYTGTTMGGWHHRQWLYQLHHNGGTIYIHINRHTLLYHTEKHSMKDYIITIICNNMEENHGRGGIQSRGKLCTYATLS